MSKDCDKCEGNMYYLVPNYQHDVMERVECIDCMLEIQYKDDIKVRLSKLLVNASHEKLAQLVAEMTVNGVDKSPTTNISRFETTILTKNLAEALMLAAIYAEE